MRREACPVAGDDPEQYRAVLRQRSTLAPGAHTGQSAPVKYEDLPPISRLEFGAAFDDGTSEQRATAIVRLALHDDDATFIDQACNRGLDTADIVVRRAALVAVGHLARLHGHVRDETQMRVRSLEAEPTLAGIASDATDDINTFARP